MTQNSRLLLLVALLAVVVASTPSHAGSPEGDVILREYNESSPLGFKALLPFEFLYNDNTRQISLNMMADEMLAGWVTFRTLWADEEPQQGNYVSRPGIENLITWAHERGMNVLLTLGTASPEWATSAPPEITDPGIRSRYRPQSQFLQNYGDWVGAAVTHYSKMGVRTFEIGNEPNSQDHFRSPTEMFAPTIDYFQMLKVASIAAHVADPDCQIVMAGLSLNGLRQAARGQNRVNWLREYYELNDTFTEINPDTGEIEKVWDYYDYLNIHPFPGNQPAGPMRPQIRETMDTMDEFGDPRMVWITELNTQFLDYPDNQFELSPKTGLKKALKVDARIQKVFWFSWKNRTPGAFCCMGFKTAGMVTYNLVRKPEFTSVQGLFQNIDLYRQNNPVLWDMRFSSDIPGPEPNCPNP